MDQVLVVPLRGAQVVFANVRCNDAPDDQAVLPEVVDDPVEHALEEQVSVLDEEPIDLARREGRQRVHGELGSVALSRCGRQAREDDLRRLRIADGEDALPPGVVVGRVARGAYEPEVVLPTHWQRHMLGGEVVFTIPLLSPDQNQRVDGEDPIPDGPVLAERYEVISNMLSHILASF